MYLVSRLINLARRIHRDGECLWRSGTALTTIGECRGHSDGGSDRRCATVGSSEGGQIARAAGAKANSSVII